MIDQDMLDVAHRIQTIYNSLESGQCKNVLNAHTFSPDADDIEEEAGPLDSFDEMLANVGAYMASTSIETPLTEEAVDLTPDYIKRKDEMFSDGTGNIQHALDDVFQNDEQNMCNALAVIQDEFTGRFKAKTSQLNSFFTAVFCHLNPEYENTAESDENTEEKPCKYIVHPNGTWESIVAWARNAKLDKEQEIAFTILAAIYVLSFLEEAEDDCNAEERTAILERKRGLEILARTRQDNKGPVCVFVTGPAGAGKCKSIANIYQLNFLNKLCWMKVFVTNNFIFHSKAIGRIGIICTWLQCAHRTPFHG